MHVEGHPIEILAMEKARCADPGPTDGDPLCLLTFRPHPDKCRDTWVLMITPEQCVRIRDTMDSFLNDPESWLHLTEARQQEIRAQEYNVTPGSSNPKGEC